jgi:2-oxoglutarate ferredoxin oxidoreductase subunit beta
VRWCPGCGLRDPGPGPEADARALGIEGEHRLRLRDRLPSRFPYYMNTWVPRSTGARPRSRRAQGPRPDLQVWVVTGDGDARSAATTSSTLRRNVDLRSCSSTPHLRPESQASPTSSSAEAKSTPYGTIDAPFNDPPRAGRGATLSATAMPMVHLMEMLRRTPALGSAFLEILQNCVVSTTRRSSRSPRRSTATPQIYMHGNRRRSPTPRVRLSTARQRPPISPETPGGKPMTWNSRASRGLRAGELPRRISRAGGRFPGGQPPVHHAPGVAGRGRRKIGAGNLAKLLRAGDT